MDMWERGRGVWRGEEGKWGGMDKKENERWRRSEECLL